MAELSASVRTALSEFKATAVNGPRIGSGRGYFVVGWLGFLAGGFFAAVAASEPAVGALAGFAIALAAGCFSVGFWKSIAHKLELRLMDIQTELVRRRIETSAADLSAKYGNSGGSK